MIAKRLKRILKLMIILPVAVIVAFSDSSTEDPVKELRKMIDDWCP